MRPGALITVLPLLVLAACGDDRADELEALLARQQAEMGVPGADRLIILTGTVTEPGWDTPLDLRLEVMQPHMARMTLTTDSSFYQQGYYDGSGWEKRGRTAPVLVLPRDGAALLRHQAFWTAYNHVFQAMRKRGGAQVRFMPEDDKFPGEKSLTGIRVTLPDGYAEDFFLDTDGLQVVKHREARPLGDWLRSEMIEIWHSDYETATGLTYPTVREEMRASDNYVFRRMEISTLDISDAAPAALSPPRRPPTTSEETGQ